jgi:hypothetical protein
MNSLNPNVARWHTCMYLCVCICVCIYLSVCICLCMYLCVCLCVCICRCMYLCVCLSLLLTLLFIGAHLFIRLAKAEGYKACLGYNY